MSNITVIGTGYVGLTTAVLLAHSGHKVFAVDINKERLESIQNGKSFFFEEGMDALVSKAVSAGNLVPTDSYQDSVSQSEYVFSSVGTPDNPDGSSNLSYVFGAAEEALKFMKPGTIYIQKSTVPVGTGEKIEQVFAASGAKAGYVSNPEFLREGTAILDSLWFDRVVVGSQVTSDAQKVTDLYKTIESNRQKIAKDANLTAPQDFKGTYFETDRNSAELVKVTSNAFLALKISFANSIAKLADHTNADINEVMDMVGSDKRIGRAFLSAGRGYGGGCFPKDVSGLISSASEKGVDMPIMVAATEVNESMPGYIANKAKSVLGNLQGQEVCVLGLAFKVGTSDARKSPGAKLANSLSNSGAKVRVFDPQANEEAKEELRRSVKICDNLSEAINGTSAIFVATEWPEFLQAPWQKLAETMSGNLFVDCVNAFNITTIEKSGLKYMGVGRNSSATTKKG